MRVHVLEREQRVPRPLDEVFAFFADARNLEAITPAWLGFGIGPVGAIAHRVLVRRDLERIFDHRSAAVGGLLH